MTNDELDEALAQLKKTDGKHAQLQKEYDSARAKCQPLTHAQAELDKAKSKYEDALDKWHELDKQFDDEHAWLIDAIDDACNKWYEAKQRVNGIIRKLTGANND
jgi:chromosome segregation ATPase